MRIADVDAAHDLDVAGEALEKVPKPWPEDHPRADLLKHKMFQVRAPVPTPAEATSEGFVGWCVDQLRQYAGVHRWLVANMA